MLVISYETKDEELYQLNVYRENIENLTFAGIIELFDLGLNSNVKCWIYEDDEDTWIKCKTAKSLNLIISGMMSQGKDGDIEIIFREIKESPNSTIVSKLTLNTSLTKHTAFNIEVDVISNIIEPFTFSDVEDIDKEELIYIPHDGKWYAIHSLSIPSFVKMELSKGTSFFDIELRIDDISIKFDKRIWVGFILRGNHQVEFLLDFFAEIFSVSSSSHRKMIEFQEDEDLLMRMKFFIADLLSFKEENIIPSSVYPQYYFSTFYFTEAEIEYLVNFPTSSGLKYKDLFDIFVLERDVLCTSHDVAPFIYKTFKISRNFRTDKKFEKAYKRYNKDNKNRLK